MSCWPDPLLKYPLFAGSHALPDIVTALPFAAVVGAVVVGGGAVVVGGGAVVVGGAAVVVGGAAVVVGGGAVVVGGGAVVTAAVVNGSHDPSLQRPLNPSFSQ